MEEVEKEKQDVENEMENIQTNLKNISKTIYEMRNRNVIINNLKSEVIYIYYICYVMYRLLIKKIILNC